jgi:hypothetical protein
MSESNGKPTSTIAFEFLIFVIILVSLIVFGSPEIPAAIMATFGGGG